LAAPRPAECRKRTGRGLSQRSSWARRDRLTNALACRLVRKLQQPSHDFI
jgi:hypothetical protein